MTRRRLTRDRVTKVVLTAAVLVVGLGFLDLPVLWLVRTALIRNDLAFTLPPPLPWQGGSFSLASFTSQLGDLSGFVRYFLNSAVTAVGTALVTVLVSLFAGYALSRLRFPGRRWLMLLILASQAFPIVIIVISLYVLYRQLLLLDTYQGLILSFTSFSLPFSIWMMRGFVDAIPPELEEAAWVDGATRTRALLGVVVPSIAPGLVAVGLFSFLTAWNNLLVALTLTSEQAMRTIPPGFLLTYVGEFQYRWSDAMAGSAMVSFPTIVLFILLQRFLVRGLTGGAVKG
jgi:multiple sugar transport system permease protein